MEGIPRGSAVGDVEQQVEQARQRAQQAATWSAQMERLTARGTAMRGGVSVELDLGGTVTGLGISDVAASRGGREVARAVLAAHRQASEELRRLATESTAQAWGADSATTQAVRDEVDRLTPAAGRGPDDDPEPTHRGGSW